MPPLSVPTSLLSSNHPSFLPLRVCVSRRRATVSGFKGRFNVDLREWYDKDGEMKPGSKGISLPEEQWGRLEAGLPGLRAAMDAPACV
jgi:hypothetical protein